MLASLFFVKCGVEGNSLIGEASGGLDRKVVKHEERRKVAKLGGANGAANAGALTLGLLKSEEGLADGTLDRHFGAAVVAA